MIWKIVKLKLKTRFSKPLIISGSVFMIGYAISIFAFYHSKLSTSYLTYLTLYLLMFLFLTINLMASIGNPIGTFIYDKSDFDFLFTIPLDKRDFALAFFIFSIIYNLLTFSLPTFILLAYIMGIYSIPLVISLAFSFTTLNVIAIKLSKYKWILFLLIELWFLSFLFKFPLSPLSIIYGEPEGYYTYIAFSLLTLPFYFKYYTIPTQLTVLALGERRRQIVFSSSIFMSMLRKNLRIAGSIGITSIRLRGYVIISLILSIVYYIFENFFKGNPLYINIVTLVIHVSFLVMIMSYAQYSLLGEAIWIYITVMDEKTFIRYYIASKLIPLYLVLLPFILTSALLGNLNEFLLATSIPLFFITATYSFLYSPLIVKQGIVIEKMTVRKIFLPGIVYPVYILVLFEFFIYFPLYVILFIVVSNIALLFISWRKAVENYVTKEV
ncbi:hypothetical protein SJAV_08460 [Sulfurisphaera javensis]|uniref:Polysaccharide biosynthesis protein n=1 Tax=Sulfurisphaera javensis TaxID=2049879 RepID=A0AAT9GPY5_9CREN